MINRRRIAVAILALLVSALGWATWYVCTKGFTRSWRQLITREFEKRGIEISLRRLTLDPLRGLVAEEVRLLDARDRRRVLATVDEMELGVNYAGALRGVTFLDSVDLRDAHLSLPVDAAHPDAAKIEISKLNARLFFPPQQVYLARAEAEVLGIQIYASGRVINPQVYHGGEPDPVMVSHVAAVLDVLSSLKYRGAPPVVSLDFSGDLEKPAEIAIDARLYADGVRRKNYMVSQVSAVASYRNGILDLHRLGANDGKGELRGSCTYQRGSGRISARIQSSMALQEFWHAYVGDTLPASLTFSSTPPKLDLSLEGVVARRYDWSVFGHVELERFDFRAVPFRSLSADVSWSGGRWSLRDFHLQHQSGDLRGNTVTVPGDFRAEVHGTINPRTFSPLFHAALNEWLGRFDFVDSPTIDLEVRGRQPTLEDCSAAGKIHFGRTLYDGGPAQNFTTDLRYQHGALSLFPFRPTKEGEEPSELIFDIRKKEVRIEKKQTGSAAESLVHGHS